MKYLGALFLTMILFFSANAQKKVDAVVDLATKTTDSIGIKKGKSFVVQLPVRNRAGDDWRIAEPSPLCKFTESMLGQVGMLPNQQEPKLYFFKAVDKGNSEIRFEYKNPKAPADAKPEERILQITVE